MATIGNRILINVEDDETRIALLNGENLENLYIEQTHHTQKVGNIYCGKVVKIQSSFQAAFIDYGEERHGFLSISDINFQVYKPTREGRGRSSISQVLKIGQKILVQVIKDEIAHKGASLTTNISIAGRFLVFMPDSDRGGVSKKIEDEEQRNRLRHLLKGLGNENSSAIIRTVGVDRSLTELKRDYTILRRTWTDIKNDYDSVSSTKLLYKEEDAMLRMIRDYYNDTVMEVLIDEPVSFQHALEFFKTYLPTEQNKLKLYLGEKSIFSNHGIENQIEILEHQEVPLPSGGSLVIIPTEALVAIDVNSGKSAQEKNIEATALRTNLEAAEEISRQLRLRNLGGLIVIDFIDMENSKNRLLVEQKIEEAMIQDKAKTSFGMISKFGLLELSRQRISSSLLNNSNIITLANRILRKIHDVAITEKLLNVRITLPLELSYHLLNNKRQRLTQMEIDYGIRIYISPDAQLSSQEIPEMEITFKEQGSLENQKSIPISNLKIRDEKRKPKKDKIKKVDNKVPSIDSENTTTDENLEKEISQERIVKNKKTLKKNKDEKTNEGKNKNGEINKPNTIENKGKRKPKNNDIKEGKKLEKNKQETQDKLNEGQSGTIFMSTHEAVDVKKLDKQAKINNELLPDKKNNITTTIESIHEDENNGNPKNRGNISQNLTEETALYSSIHLDENENQATKSPERQDSNSKTSKESEISIQTKIKKNQTKKNTPLTLKNKKQSNSKKVESQKKSQKNPKNNSSKKNNAIKDKISKSLPDDMEEITVVQSASKVKESKLNKPKNDSKKSSLKSSKTKNSAA